MPERMPDPGSTMGKKNEKQSKSATSFFSASSTRRVELSPMRDTCAHICLMSWTKRHADLYPPGAPVAFSQPPEAKGDWRVLVKGIHPAATEAHLRTICAKFGVLSYIRMPTQKHGPALVSFQRREDAEECVRMVDGRMIGGWTVHLSLTNPPRDKTRPPRLWPPNWQYRVELPGIIPPP
jgi:hypothetical protein